MIVDGLVDSCVCSLTTAVSLWVVGGQHLEFHASELMEGSPKVSGEDQQSMTKSIGY